MMRALSTRVVRVLVLGNGAAGAEKQALALGARLRDRLLAAAGVTDKRASSLTCPPVDCVRVTLSRSPLLRLLPPALQVLGARVTHYPFFGYANAHEIQTRLQSMKPGLDSTLNVVIGCGRSTVALCAVLKQLDADRTFNVQIQHPRVPLAWFDAVVAPRHDFSTDDNQIANLFVTPGTVHDISNALLQRHEHEWHDELEAKLLGRRTRIVWLVGGPCRGFQFTVQDAERMVDQFERALPRDADVAVLVTFSRRTPAEVQRVIRQRLHASLSLPGQILVWDGTERRNPYYALLATASIVVTTPDSISMTTEAIASGKPVFTISAEHSKVGLPHMFVAACLVY
ncbi:hypothetical protein BBJ28_00004756 [Nothophytophthora sp. Chile5]|nr:hypothetical protein BBJ28_00004756 [Nothophytophthora sp. Chile5]